MKYRTFLLSELATIKYGKNQAKVVCDKSEIPIYGTGGLMGNATKPLYDKPSVLIGRKGTIGKVKYVDHPFWTVDTLFYTEVNESEVFPLYLYYYMSQIDLNQYNEGTTIPSLRTETLNRLEIAIPSKDIQKKVLAVLETIDKKIDTNSEINHNLQQQAIALFDSKFPCVSQGNRTIGEYIIPKRGRNLLSKDAIPGEIPVVAGGLEPATYHNCANTKAPVLTISASGANAGFVNLWNNPVWSSDSSYIDSSMSKDVYFWFVMLKKRQQEIFDSQTGSAQPHIYPQHIAAMPVCELNPLAVNEYTSLVSPLFASIGANQKENNRLVALRDALLPKLMSGEIDVSEVEI